MLYVVYPFLWSTLTDCVSQSLPVFQGCFVSYVQLYRSPLYDCERTGCALSLLQQQEP
jgi:hypothetical protein